MGPGISRVPVGQGPNVLVGHLVAHGGVISMHLIVALHDLNQKLQLNNDEFGTELKLPSFQRAKCEQGLTREACESGCKNQRGVVQVEEGTLGTRAK